MDKEYMLERAYPYRAKGIGNTKEAGFLTWKWKQIAKSNDLEALKQIKTDDMRIVDWSTGEIVAEADQMYSQIIF